MTKIPSKTSVPKCVSAEIGRKLPTDPDELRQVLRDAVDVCMLQEPEPTRYVPAAHINRHVGFQADPTLIDRALAMRAHSGTSFTPEKRGEYEIESFVDEVERVRKTLMQSTESADELVIVDREMDKFQEQYAKKWNEQMAAHSRIISPMITGGANFPVRRNQKACDAHHNRITEMIEYKERVINAITKKLKEHRIMAGGGEIAMMEKKLASAEADQARMKAVNKILRNKKISDDEKAKRVHEEFGLPKQLIHELMTPDWGSPGYPAYKLTNNNANIKRMKERVKEMRAREGTPTTEIAFAGGTIIDSNEDDRVQIFYDEKPSSDTIKQLKSSGWHWAPSLGVWQRKRTSAAMASAKQIVGVGASPVRYTPAVHTHAEPTTYKPNPNVVTQPFPPYPPKLADYKPAETWEEFVRLNAPQIAKHTDEMKEWASGIPDVKQREKKFNDELRQYKIGITDIYSKLPTKEEFYSREYWHDPKRGRHPASGSGRLPSKEFAQIEIRYVGDEPAIRIYNPWTKEEIYYYDLNQMDEAKERFENLYAETFGTALPTKKVEKDIGYAKYTPGVVSPDVKVPKTRAALSKLLHNTRVEVHREPNKYDVNRRVTVYTGQAFGHAMGEGHNMESAIRSFCLRNEITDADGRVIVKAHTTPTYIPRQPPAGSGLQMQASLTGGGGQTYFAGGSPQRRGKIAAKRTPRKREKKGSGSLAMFGVMPEGQATL